MSWEAPGPGRWAARVRVALAAGSGLALLLAGCTGAASPDPSTSPAPSGSLGVAVARDEVAGVLYNELEAETFFGMDPATYARMRQTAVSLPWRLVDAGSVQQAAACTGTGAPTVVYIDGWRGPAAGSWSLAAAEQARTNRVCLFDRPGLGLSPARRGAAPHSTPEQQAEEMLAMLTTLGEPGPYLLVPWSYGGLVARAAATAHPDQIAGMVMVDASSPLQSAWDEPLQGENGIVDVDTIATSVGGGPDMGDRPVIVLTAGQNEGSTAAAWTEWLDLQKQAATISQNAVHAVVDDSDHAIPLRDPQTIVAATTAVAESIRDGNAPLHPCPDSLNATGATCKANGLPPEMRRRGPGASP
jgi:thioesterase domain-containing protein